MRRNLDLVRALLLEVEKNDDPYEPITPKVAGFSELEVSYHIALMEEAGLVVARDRSAIGVFYWSATRLTFAGHELLDCVRDETVWNEAKHAVDAAAGGIALTVLRQVLIDRIAERIAGAR